MFFPYSTDAPVYHWPYGTVGLIVANVLLFFGVAEENLLAEGPWMLQYGSGWNPLQWIGSRFMHAGIFHLLGNMLFLWVFGLVVEGKLGALKFLACYLGIGVLQAAVEQAVMLGYSGMIPGSLGASAAIYGIMAMAAVWAPANHISFFYFLAFFVRGIADLPISWVAGFYIGLDLVYALFLGGWAGSSLLHLSGALLGFPLAVLLLRTKVVDCEGWDLFTLSGLKRPGQVQEETARRENEERRRQRQEEQRREHLADAKRKFHEFLRAGNLDAALTLHEKMKDQGLQVEPAERMVLVKNLHAAARWRESAPFMDEIIQESPDRADPVRLRLAQICVVELDRPGRALELIREIDSNQLNEKQRLLAKKLVAKAQAMQMEGCVELDDDSW